jgi:hypothetical protein
MTWTRWLGVSVATLMLGAAPQAEELKVLYTAPVTVDEAEVRCGPGDTPQLYVTSRLHRGDTVQVVKMVDDHWLAIRPPPGSFSWINTRFVRQIMPGRAMWLVTADSGTTVPLLAGSAIKSDKPTVESIRVSPGQQLVARSSQKIGDDGYYLPVEPVVTEVRYIRADALARNPAQTTSITTPPGVTPDGPPGPFTPPPPGVGAPAQPTLAQSAQEAERKGQYSEAIRLYEQLARETINSDHNTSVWASNQAQRLRDALAVRPPASTGNPPAAQPSLPAGYTRSGPGWLRRVGRNSELNPLYVLENSRGLPIVYAVAGTGYTLSPYENRNVDLIGVRQYRGDLRAYQMTVMQIQPLQ